MNCPKCNSIVADYVNFCPYCGKSLTIDEPNPEVVMPPVAEKAPEPVAVPTPIIIQAAPSASDYQSQRRERVNAEIAELDNAIRHFSAKLSVYDRYDNACAKLKHYKSGSSVALMVWGIVLSSLAITFLMIEITVLAYLMFPGFPMLLGGIAMKVNNAVKRSHYENEYARLALELYNHFRIYPNPPVPAEYTNPRILTVIINTVRFGRTDTIRDALSYTTAPIQDNVNMYLYTIQRYTNEVNLKNGIPVIFAASYLFG